MYHLFWGHVVRSQKKSAIWRHGSRFSSLWVTNGNQLIARLTRSPSAQQFCKALLYTAQFQIIWGKALACDDTKGGLPWRPFTLLMPHLLLGLGLSPSSAMCPRFHGTSRCSSSCVISQWLPMATNNFSTLLLMISMFLSNILWSKSKFSMYIVFLVIPNLIVTKKLQWFWKWRFPKMGVPPDIPKLCLLVLKPMVTWGSPMT